MINYWGYWILFVICLFFASLFWVKLATKIFSRTFFAEITRYLVSMKMKKEM